MRVDRHFRGHFWLLIPLLAILITPGCKVYTINKTDLETKLRPEKGEQKFLKIGNMYRKPYKNDLDTLFCIDEIGRIRPKRFNGDTKITIVTRENKAIKYYAKSLYIYNDQFLIGERTAPRLRGPNYYPVRLSEIDRIEVSAISF